MLLRGTSPTYLHLTTQHFSFTVHPPALLVWRMPLSFSLDYKKWYEGMRKEMEEESRPISKFPISHQHRVTWDTINPKRQAASAYE
jgi:hypothetical protein